MAAQRENFGVKKSAFTLLIWVFDLERIYNLILNAQAVNLFLLLPLAGVVFGCTSSAHMRIKHQQGS